MPPKTKAQSTTLGFEGTLWKAADLLRGHMDAAEYKHVVLGLIFLKYASDAFDERREEIVNDQLGEGAEEDKDEYTAEGVIWVPKSARWETVQADAKQPSIGKTLDAAMQDLERENLKLKDVLPKVYARPSLDKSMLGRLVDVIGSINLRRQQDQSTALEDAPKTQQDILGRIYEYFLKEFAKAENKQGGEFYTPESVVRVLVDMLAPYKGRIYDPACGAGGIFVQSDRFVRDHKGTRKDLSVFGQESNYTTWKLAHMNLGIRGIEANLGKQNADSFLSNQHTDQRFDYIFANPPFNISQWNGERLREDVRWKYGLPPVGNANYAWVQHIIHHLAPNGTAGFVLANGSLSSNQSNEGEIRKNILEADLVDCIVAMPGQLFYSTQIPVSLWFVARNKRNGKGLEGKLLRDRSREVLFIDARKLGFMEDRTHRALSDEEINRITGVYHNWRGDGDSAYQNETGFCQAASLEEIRAQNYVLTPGRYVTQEAQAVDTEPFEQKLERLTKDLESHFAESARLEEQIRENMKLLQPSEARA